MSESQVARILATIQSEYEAAQRGLQGTCSGASKHSFISSRMERIAVLHGELRGIVGDSAIAMVAAHLEAIPEEKEIIDPTE